MADDRRALNVLDGDGLTVDQIVAEAYGHVAAGYRRALTVPGLPEIERGDLRAALRAAAAIARDPALCPIARGAE